MTELEQRAGEIMESLVAIFLPNNILTADEIAGVRHNQKQLAKLIAAERASLPESVNKSLLAAHTFFRNKECELALADLKRWQQGDPETRKDGELSQILEESENE